MTPSEARSCAAEVVADSAVKEEWGSLVNASQGRADGGEDVDDSQACA